MCSCSVVLSETNIKHSKKSYECGASLFMREIPRDAICELLTFSEKRQWIAAKKKKYRITEGEPYFRQVQVSSDGMFIFRALPGLHEICLKYDFYPDCC